MDKKVNIGKTFKKNSSHDQFIILSITFFITFFLQKGTMLDVFGPFSYFQLFWANNNFVKKALVQKSLENKVASNFSDFVKVFYTVLIF